ncbi:50S ribosomal protein L24 [Hibiscus syriacus]|uniref:50S ribosomal protein L24 n=1 Tax=Hibiscus syriacus TaxID=106335 RepID=A0A6A3AJX6_HIBSY|nr:50S ribosomal protein L24 [Hibiscus syriacus]
MAAMAALQSSLTGLSLSSNSFLGQRLSIPPSFSPLHLKRWERKECKPNSLPVLHKLHVKVGDTIKVISGRDKGKIGEVSKIFNHNSTIVVKDINLKTKHMKSREEGQPGQIIKVMLFSNVMLYSKEKEVTSRMGHKVSDTGKKVRYLIKTGEIIDSDENRKQLKEAAKEKTEVATAAPTVDSTAAS